jgi:hypothetical protein
MVMLSRFAFVATIAAMFSAVLAQQSQQLSIIAPGGPDLWWVAKSQNVLVWTCQTSPYMNFTVLISNPDQKILPATLAIIAIQQNYVCSLEVTQDMSNQNAGTGYTILFADPLNATNVYTESQPFEIKPLGSTYPPPSATPTAGGANGTASATGAGATASSSGKSGASSTKLSVAYVLVAAAALVGLMTA